MSPRSAAASLPARQACLATARCAHTLSLGRQRPGSASESAAIPNTASDGCGPGPALAAVVSRDSVDLNKGWIPTELGPRPAQSSPPDTVPDRRLWMQLQEQTGERARRTRVRRGDRVRTSDTQMRRKRRIGAGRRFRMHVKEQAGERARRTGTDQKTAFIDPTDARRSSRVLLARANHQGSSERRGQDDTRPMDLWTTIQVSHKLPRQPPPPCIACGEAAARRLPGPTRSPCGGQTTTPSPSATG